MIKVVVPDMEYYDERTETFENVKGCVLKLEHSLISISKWEAKWKKPYLVNEQRTNDEFLDYVRCMTINHVEDKRVYRYISYVDMNRIKEYIADPMTATTFSETIKMPHMRERVTSELIYYWMIYNNIPFEAEKWHISRLLTLIRICSIKGQQPKKMSQREQMNYNSSLNKARRAKYHTKG